MLLHFNIYFLICFLCLRYLSENKIEALPDKIFKGVKKLRSLWVQLITYKTFQNIWSDRMNMISAFKTWDFCLQIYHDVEQRWCQLSSSTKQRFLNLYCTKNVPLYNILFVHLGGYYEKAETNIVEIYVVLTEIPWEFIRMRNVTAASPRFGVSCK